MTEKRDRILIIGGGLAGSCAALEVAKRGASVELVHQNSETGLTASKVPLALYNPAAALRARKGWQAEACHEALHELIDEVSHFLADDSFVSKTGVLRPCLDEEMAVHFRNSAEMQEWPEGWVQWLEPEEVKTRFPKSEYRWGGLWVKAGMTIDTPALLEGMHRMVTETYGCTVTEKKITEIREEESGVEVISEDGSSAVYKQLIIAAGAFARKLTGSAELKLHSVKGQTTETEPFLPDSFEPSVSSKGYIALHKNRVVIGSTYEHHYKDYSASPKSENYLLQKVPRSFPEISLKDLKVKTSWAGIRVTTPDRLPLIGLLPGKSKVYLTTGFGSKGVIYSPYCGKLLAEYLVNNAELPHEVSIMRQQFPGDAL